MDTADGCNTELNRAWGFVKNQTRMHNEVENEVLFVLVGPISSPNWLDLTYPAVPSPPLELVAVGVLGGARQFVENELIALFFIGAQG